MSKRSIAILGPSGTVGQAIIKALESGLFADRIQFPVKAITRNAKPSTSTVEYIEASLDEPDKIIELLKGVDVVVEALNPDPSLLLKAEPIVLGLKPKLFIPSQFGTENSPVDSYIPGLFTYKDEHSARIRAAGIQVIDIATAVFAQPGGYGYAGPAASLLGIDATSNSATTFGNASDVVSFTNVEDIGKVVVSIASDPDFSKYPHWVRVTSDIVSLQQVYETYEKNHNVKLNITTVPREDAFATFKETWASEGFVPTKFPYYIQICISRGLGQGIYFDGNENELVNPGEKYWKWEKY